MGSQSTYVRHNTQQRREARGKPEARKEAAHCATCAHFPCLFTCAQLTFRSSRAHSHPFPSLHPSFHLPTPFARVDSVYITTTPVPCPSQRSSSGQSLYVGLNPPTLLVHPSATSCIPPPSRFRLITHSLVSFPFLPRGFWHGTWGVIVATAYCCCCCCCRLSLQEIPH